MTTATMTEPTLTFEPISHRYFLGERELIAVSTALKEANLCPAYGSTDAAVRGQYVHAACCLLDEDDLDLSTLDQALGGYVKAYVRFKQERGFVPTASEQMVYHLLLGFAGTLDRLGILSGHHALLDLKTGSEARWHSLQTAAYALCVETEID